MPWIYLNCGLGISGRVSRLHSPSSLEARLAGAKWILEHVEDLLDDLIQALNDLLKITSGSRENRRIAFENSIDDNDLSSSKYQLEAEARPGVEKDEFQDIFDVTIECIRSLFRIRIIIRKATPRGRYAKVLQGGDSFIDQVDINYVAKRYPKLNRPDSAWLCERLGRAITKRRQFLRSSREHRSQILGPDRNDGERSKPYALPIDSSEGTTFETGFSPQIHSLVGTELGRSDAGNTYVSTKPSTMGMIRLGQFVENKASIEDALSLILEGLSLHIESGSSRLQLPSFAELGRGTSTFECPLCLGIQTFTEESEWTRHAYGDLKAYVCTCDKGECDSEMFGDRHTWFNHEFQCHKKQWICVLCSKGPFKTPADFKSHAENKHANFLFNNGQLEVFMHLSQRAVDTIAADECPFCDEWGATLRNDTDPSGFVITVESDRFRHHVASHMEQLALFAILRSIGDDEAEEGTNQVVAPDRSTVNAAPQSLVLRGSKTDDEWALDPPLHMAAASGDLATFRVLLEEGADIHLRGETWGTALDAALSCQQSTRDDILNILRNLSERPSEPLSEPPRERLGRTPSPSPSPEPPMPDDDIYHTADIYTCSECGYEGVFEYETNKDDACCKKCYHMICSSCTKC
ncbi:hypothetical protein GGS24DRAFT_472772 [Hypoxylon argillaceum]|nr:hypothetical protein GGS24DRAFT_472772 [Hypoxylon argillaceum]